MATHPIRLYVDRRNKRLLRNPGEPEPITAQMLANYVLGGQRKLHVFVGELDDGGEFVAEDISSNHTLRVGITNPVATPTSGTLRLGYGGTDGASIDVRRATQGAIEGAFNAISTVATAGGADVIKPPHSPDLTFSFLFREDGSRTAISCDVEDCYPVSAAIIEELRAGDSNTREQQHLAIRVQPYAYVDSGWSAISAPAGSWSTVATGTVAKAHVADIILTNEPKPDSTFIVDGGSGSWTRPIPADASAGDVASAINAVEGANTVRVQKIARFQWRIYWQAVGAKTLQIDDAGLDALPGLAGNFSLNTSAFAAAARDSANGKIPAIFEIQIDDGTNDETAYREEITLHNSGIDPDSVVALSVAAGINLGDLSDVVLTSPSDNQSLTYDSASGTWVNETVSGGGGSGDMAALTYDPAGIEEQLAGLTATQTLTNKTLTSPTINSPALGADSVDAITEIASALKTGSDTKLVTGTAGTSGNFVSWNADGDAVDSGSAAATFATAAQGAKADGALRYDAAQSLDAGEKTQVQENIGFDDTGTVGIVFRSDTSGVLSQIKSNLTATSDPGINNGVLQNYLPGSLWLNTTTPAIFQCVDNTAGAAAWHQLSPQTAAQILALLLTVDGAGSSLDSDLLDGEEGSHYLDMDNMVEGADTKILTAAERAKLTYIAITQSVDLDALESAVAALSNVVVLKGTWDASSGSFPGSGTALAGWSYIVSVGGTVDGVEFTANDRIVAIADNASTSTYASNWHKLDYTDAVLSVAGLTGAISASGLRTALSLGALALLATVGTSQIDDAAVTLAKMAAAAKTVPVTIEIANADGLAVDDSRHSVGGAPYGIAFTKWTLAAFDAAGDPLSTTLTVSFRAKNGSVPGALDELGSASLSAASSATNSSPGWTALTAGYYTTCVISALSGTAPASIILQLEGTKA